MRCPSDAIRQRDASGRTCACSCLAAVHMRTARPARRRSRFKQRGYSKIYRMTDGVAFILSSCHAGGPGRGAGPAIYQLVSS
ncbi:hypothetical protein EJB05_47226, partial [Eragrostis curvula]